MARNVYLVAYDISCPRRLRTALKLVKAHRVAGQKSVAECLLSGAERDRLGGRLEQLIDRRTDRLHLFRLDPRMKPRLFGIASSHAGQPFIIS